MDQLFVSRAGQKLKHALDTFKIDVTGKICADLGCNKGGFTDCLLQNGAKKVYSVDTGYGVLDWKLRNDQRVIVMERTNALHLELPEKMDFIAIDVGWTKQKLILPVALKLLTAKGQIVSLLKPHYEAEKSWLKGGKVKEEFLEKTLEKVKTELAEQNIKIQKMIESPITGKQGENTEYLILVINNPASLIIC